MSELEPQPVERHEEVVVTRAPGVEQREQVIHDYGAERQQSLFQASHLIWLFFGAVEVLIGLRVLLKLMAANPNNPFANLIYSLSYLFVWPFVGLTATPSLEGIVLEIPSLIAMLVYALVAVGIERLVWVLFERPRARVVSVHRSDRY
jgi:hypothetical protein